MSKKRRVIIACLIGIVGIFSVYTWHVMQEYRGNAALYSESLAAIENGEYQKAAELLTQLEVNLTLSELLERFPDALDLENYAFLMHMEQEGASMDSLEHVASLIHSDYQGYLSEQVSAKVKEIHNEYKQYESAEKQKNLQSARASLADKIPYQGMSEAYIDITAAGKHDEYEPPKQGFSIGTYRWLSSDTKKTVLVVDCADGKVTDVIRYYEDQYWTSAGMPHFEGKLHSGSTQGTSGKKTAAYQDSYDDGNQDVYDDGDYDWDRYYEDEDYARGVDDAIDELEEDGEEW